MRDSIAIGFWREENNNTVHLEAFLDENKAIRTKQKREKH